MSLQRERCRDSSAASNKFGMPIHGYRVTRKVRSSITAIAGSHSSGRKSINDWAATSNSPRRADNFQPFSRLARVFQLTTILQVALRRPLSTCHLRLPGKHSTRADQRDDRLARFAQSRTGDRS
jgi:hypothetical protein